MDRSQELFVPVHGHVNLYPEEIAIIDHPAFQRLRRVRQLGLAHMVFPGATHTRFEHSVGAAHVAQMIVDHVNDNYRKAQLRTPNGDWKSIGINHPTARLIRLGALLHDIGHLPFGHTLEDELHHLKPHDGNERLSNVSGRPYKHYEIRQQVAGKIERPEVGWSLENLVDQLYQPTCKELGITISPFRVLTQIVCKAPKTAGSAQKTWQEEARALEEFVDLDVCRDIVGNTICADFLDYLFRDWHHLGKSLYLDRRLYQYMEVGELASGAVNQQSSPQFVINVGALDKIRHDALTDILELLNARYKLAETVLFHRTKLALTGLLDRSLLEIRKLFVRLGLPEDDVLALLEKRLLDSSDDGLIAVLEDLVAGGSEDYKKKMSEALKAERESLEVQLTPTATPRLYDEHANTEGPLKTQSALVRRLVDRLRDRGVYSLVYKLKISDFSGPHNPDNPTLKKVLRLYSDPKNRLDFLQGIEALCGLPAGSLVMYCPPDAKMNAKVAEVNLLVEGAIWPFDEYEAAQGDSSLTRGALSAQVQRFYELWGACVYIERTCWERLPEATQRNLRSVIKRFFFRTEPDAELKILRSQIQCSINAVSDVTSVAAFRDRLENPPTVEKYKGFKFPSGLAFAIEDA